MSKFNKGSRLRCLMLTGLPRDQFAAVMNDLIKPSGAIVTMNDCWMPHGLTNEKEAQLHHETGLPSDQVRKKLSSWWLLDPKRRSPNWDIACSCMIEGKRGLVLVEAKAHTNELPVRNKCGASTKESRDKIKSALGSTNKLLNQACSGEWQLSTASHYQLSNRFAWSCKLATFGIPVVLVYLGFLNALEMEYKDARCFENHKMWRTQLLNYSAGVVPAAAWGSAIDAGKAKLWPLIRSMDIGFKVH